MQITAAAQVTSQHCQTEIASISATSKGLICRFFYLDVYRTKMSLFGKQFARRDSQRKVLELEEEEEDGGDYVAKEHDLGVKFKVSQAEQPASMASLLSPTPGAGKTVVKDPVFAKAAAAANGAPAMEKWSKKGPMMMLLKPLPLLMAKQTEANQLGTAQGSSRSLDEPEKLPPPKKPPNTSSATIYLQPASGLPALPPLPKGFCKVEEPPRRPMGHSALPPSRPVPQLKLPRKQGPGHASESNENDASGDDEDDALPSGFESRAWQAAKGSKKAAMRDSHASKGAREDPASQHNKKLNAAGVLERRADSKHSVQGCKRNGSASSEDGSSSTDSDSSGFSSVASGSEGQSEENDSDEDFVCDADDYTDGEDGQQQGEEEEEEGDSLLKDKVQHRGMSTDGKGKAAAVAGRSGGGTGGSKAQRTARADAVVGMEGPGGLLQAAVQEDGQNEVGIYACKRVEGACH